MVLRYANALVAAGWEITVMMPPGLREVPFARRLFRHGRYWVWRITQGYTPRNWMSVDARVRMLWVPSLIPQYAPKADVVVATAVQTAEAVACWPEENGRKYYFVQGYETWDFSEERVQASWRLPLRKIAISRWLCDSIRGVGEQADHLPNGLDPEAFGLDCPLSKRSGLTILWPHHASRLKGSTDVVAALNGLPDEFPGLTVRAFGTGPAPDCHSTAIRYSQNPTQKALRELYNQASVFIAPSHSEGWGLPACEALQCGCVLAASDIGGHREFLQHQRNALLHPPGDVTALRQNIRLLLADSKLRERLSANGVADMALLRFEPAVERLQQILMQEAK